MEQGGDGVYVVITADSGELPHHLTEEEKVQYLSERRKFEMDQYYNKIAKHSFKTVFLELAVDEVKAWRQYNINGKLNEEESVLMNKFKDRVKSTIEDFHKEQLDVFIRLSTRSPKDAVDKMNKVLPLIRHELSKIKHRDDDSELEKLNDQLIALRAAFFKSMKVRDVDEFLELFMYSSRTVSDIKRALDHIDKSPWNLKLIFREYQDMPIQGEFRGFVHQNSLNAITQYYTDCYFPLLVKLKDRLSESILKYYNSEIKEELNDMENYIIDFVVLNLDNININDVEDGGSNDHISFDIKVIELNPFSLSTGSGLFSWQKDEKIIKEGPFEMRVNTSVDKHISSSLSIWKPLLDQAQFKVKVLPLPDDNNEKCTIQ
eukprot:TRINITY_DN8049_c0_g1_i1.p1 TRINITY_DN8049_c0_g1~~TRINITY_DN8049_c0_g1_i1.p1  ORF type:complete len:375 (-),score=73.03 TRINITY_DN8049_c0_g1_i1:15-1139(-)